MCRDGVAAGSHGRKSNTINPNLRHRRRRLVAYIRTDESQHDKAQVGLLVYTHTKAASG